MGLLRVLGALLILIWLVLWLAVKITVGTVHLLVLLGVVLLVVSFFKAAKK